MTDIAVDKTKTIEGLEELEKFLFSEYGRVSTEEADVWYDRFLAVDNALELLKEQEPMKAVADGEDSYMCNNCGTVIGWAEWEPGGIEDVKYKFCPECGRPVKWE